MLIMYHARSLNPHDFSSDWLKFNVALPISGTEHESQHFSAHVFLEGTEDC